MQTMGIRVVAVDVGSVGPPSKVAWAAFEPPAREAVMSGNDPQSAVSAVVAGLAWGGQAALLLESPLSVPVPPGQADGWRLVGKARAGEGNRAWLASAATCWRPHTIVALRGRAHRHRRPGPPPGDARELLDLPFQLLTGGGCPLGGQYC
jgi:hypothetical protein